MVWLFFCPTEVTFEPLLVIWYYPWNGWSWFGWPSHNVHATPQSR